MWRWSEPSPGRVRHSQWGARDAGANEITGKNGSQWNDGGSWERQGRSGFPQQSK